ncbi:hypothetical protein [Stackebrandtia nassauensis]|uniref:Uncharacterized protein n=1 Tax=Stackebrandtia nassauensis (strain DSM 44728 / CIP 108903 / NRRL B-16338 / NBRC 102104 / LLR-40K-21) TaxID=446470 RepID=D3Q6F5_STANL|nr:hypothetical protein [Stackebrandtia nassauensis]ADD44198.1 hypothetical protein Snas_4554 [Stackebrandtia nassauensis DSM 44728]
MTGQRLEQRAASMLAAYQRIAAKMYTLDSHAGRRFLKDEQLSGATADIAGRVNARAAVLWSRFDELRRLSDQIPTDVDGLGDTARAKLEALLGSECVKLDASGVPALASGDAVTTESSLSAFADDIEAECAELLRLCSEVDDACGVVADAIAEVTGSLEDVTARAETLGMAGNATLAELRADRSSLLETTLSDPASAVDDLAGLAELSRRIGEFGQRLASLEAVARDFPARLSALRADLAELGEAEDRTAQTCALAVEKILDPAPPRFTPQAATLSNALRELGETAADSDRHSLAARLSELTSRVEEAIRQCRRVADTAEALLDRRAELRGRLAAYSRKAARLGVIEEPRVAASAATARELLSLAPCDLRSATSAVRQFQQEISGAQEAPA